MCAAGSDSDSRMSASTPGPLSPALRQVRKVIVLVVGSTVVLAGIAMMVLPGPAVVVIPAGLAILATEFVWARRLLRRARERLRDATGSISRRESETRTSPQNRGK